MSKGGGRSVDIPWQMTQAYGNLGNIAQQQQNLSQDALNFAKQMYAYGKQRTEKYWDPVLNQALEMVSGTPGEHQYASPLNMAMNQYPQFAGKQALGAAVKNIQENVRPGPQQSALLAQAENQNMQNVTSGAYQNVNNMLQMLSGQGNAVWQGAQMGQQGYSQAGGLLAGAAGTYGQQAGIGGQIAQIQQYNNQMQLQNMQAQGGMIGSIANTIGQIGGYAFGQWAGSPTGAAAIGSFLGV